MDQKYLINFDEIDLQKKIGETQNSITYLTTLTTNSLKCVTKIFNEENNEMEPKFNNYVQRLQQINHQAIIPFIGFSTSQQNILRKNMIINKFAPHLSLKDIFEKQFNGESLPWWDLVRQLIIIYGVARAMQYLHEQNITHQRLTPSNILIDENLEPQITDFDLAYLYPTFNNSVSDLIKNKLFYYIDPCVLNGNGEMTVKSDVYSFAIIVLQILTGNIHIYENEDDLENLISEIKRGLTPMIPLNYPDELRNLLLSCFDKDQILRPSFSQICLKLESIINSLPGISIEIFKEYKDKIDHIDDEMSPEVRKMKEAADNGDADMMYLYAKKRLDGINCKQNQTEATRYFKMANERGNNAAKRQLSLLRNNSGSIAASVSNEFFDQSDLQVIEKKSSDNNANDNIYDNINDNNEELTRLADDPSYDQTEINIGDFLSNIDNEIKQENKFIFNKDEVEQQNFIFTNGAEERLQKLYNYIMVGVPVLLEGPTGTSKTLSSEIVCKLLGRELIRFNLSSETKTQDLIGRYVGDENSWAGITQQDGPFSKAFKEGKVLLLDEINLASASVLQCIEEALDSGILSIEIPGRPLKSIKMNPNFRVIATQNPNKGSYAHKRQNLGLKFYSRFQVINFPAFSEDELLFIGKGLAEKFGYEKMDVIQDLVKFHKEWSENPIIAEDTQCFTIREIAATVKALSQKESIYDTIMTIYGARYQSSLKTQLKNVLSKYPCLIDDSKEFEIPEFSGCYINESLRSAVKSTIFSLENGRNVILTGKEGCGKTQVAIWISEYYNKKIQGDNKQKRSFFCVCTEEIKVADLVGHQAPSGKSDGTSELIKWQDGFLTEAIKLGKCSVLESIDEAPATVTERLNGLLDQKYDNQQKYFDIPENSANPRIPIMNTFRILATANIDKTGQMSPAFLNRFDIIVLENQIDDNITKEQFYDLLSIIMNKYASDLTLRANIIKTTDNHEEEEDKDFLLDSDFEFSDGEEEKKDEPNNASENNKPQLDDEKKDDVFLYSQNIVPMIYDKIKDEKNISRVAKICSSIVKLCSVFQNNAEINDKDIVEFAFLLLQNNKEFDVPIKIENELLNMFQEIEDNTDDPFFYQDSPSLRSFLSKLQAYSIIGQPVCVSGPTGAGKTSAARAFARMRPCKSEYKSGFQMHSFHSGTKISHFFGSTTLLDGDIVFNDGTLTKSLKNGLVFIADEFNLSTQSVMKSLSLALDPTIGKNVFIPGIGRNIEISPEFHFIACQNELGTLGRNAIPDSIAQRFSYIDYPKPEKEDIQKICISISREIISTDRIFTPEDEELARDIANYMIRLNDRKFIYIPQWSLRDITKLFRRIYHRDYLKKFKDITPLHHVLFYTLSAVSPNDIKFVIDNVRAIMKFSFNLNDQQVDEYIDCYKATPEIREIRNQGLYLMKGPKVGISINRIKQLTIEKTLPSLWNAVFQVYLSDEKEPILLMGNSGFKTFLAQHFLPNAQIITLNQETNVAQLLGSSGFMTNSEAKLFYIDYICKIMQNDSLISELRSKWENGNLKRSDIFPLIVQTKRGPIPYSFCYALDHLAEKLFADNVKNHDGILSNTTLEFRPGLFLNSILQKQSLILKDLSNLPTIVLERFNELFSGKQNITLSEDIHDTFTPSDNKELTNFNDTFRVFATCPENSTSKLSEAVLSRFSVIAVPEYSNSEQEIVLKSYIQINNLIIDQSDIDHLSDFASMYLINLKNLFTFPQMIKVIEITSKLNRETSIDFQKLNIGVAIYRVLGGILDSNKKKEILFNQIKLFFDIPDAYQHQINDECILRIHQKDNAFGVISNSSNLFLKCSMAQECKAKVAFTESFNDMLDLIHMVLTIHNPLILEGPPGQGKHTAINYVAKMLNMNIIHIMISQSTKVEDLFGKDIIIRQQDGIHVKMVETQFIKIIKSQNFENKALIILENINSASPALLNALVPVFDTHSTSILLPNGSTINKGKFDIIGIFNTQQVSSSKEKLPSSLINSSIYHIVLKPKESEILNIILVKFLYSGLTREEAIRFNNSYNEGRNILSKDVLSSDVFTLNEIEKYILFRTLTKDFFDETTISQMIFAYKFSSTDMINTMLKGLKLENMKFNPLFSYNVPPNALLIRISNDDKNGLLLPLNSPPNDISIISKIDSLTLPQKHCLIFLACSVLSKRSCVIQGDTASGKSYLIRLFADLIGAKLNVFQMNSDSNVSMLAGQSVLNDNLSSSDINKIKKSFADLCIDENIRQYLEETAKFDINDPKTFNPKSMKKLLDFIKTIEPRIHDKKYYPEIENTIRTIKKILNPVNRFEHHESAFIHAIRNGEWVLIDGIESAPSVIAEKISSLCGNEPELNLYEYGPDFYFTKSKESRNRISDNFHLFITYNPNSMKESQSIDQTFLIKSVTFTLPPIDDNVENSAQMLLGSLINMKYPFDLSKEIAARFASMHQFAKTISQKNPDDFAADIQYNARTLKFATKAFSINEKQSNENSFPDIAKSICFSTKSFYWNSYINEANAEQFHSKCIEYIKQHPNDELLSQLQIGDMSLEARNKKILALLRNIQRLVLGKTDKIIYSLESFVQLCNYILISDLRYVQKYIKNTIKIIKSNSNQINNPIILYGSLYSLRTLFEQIISPEEPIKKEHTFLSLKNEELRNNKSIARPLSKFDLLVQLLADKIFSEQSSILLMNQDYSNMIEQIAMIASNPNKRLIVELFKQIEAKPSLIDFVDMVFPYFLFKETNLSKISFWLPLSKKLIRNKIRFSLTIDNYKIEFNKLSTSDFSFDLIMNEEGCLSLTKGSVINYVNNKKTMKVKEHNKDENEKYDLMYYSLISDLAANPQQKIDNNIFGAKLSKAKKKYLNNEIESPSINLMMSLKCLFQQKQISLISIIWNIVFTLPENQIIDLSIIIHPIESKLLLSVFSMFISVDKELMDDISNWNGWASEIEYSIPILFKSFLVSDITNMVSLSKADEMLMLINEEISYLQKASELMKEFWDSEELINICEKKLIQVMKMKNDNDEFEKIQKKINDLKNSLINNRVPQKYNNMKIEIVNQLNLISDYTEDKFNFAQKMVNQFLSIVNSSMFENKNSKIIWPQIEIKLVSKPYQKTENIKLFEALIWYSKINSILKEINAGNNIMDNLWKLNDFEEMSYPRAVLLTNLIKNANLSQSTLGIKDRNQALFTLNSHMILKLININPMFIKDPNKICNVINDYINRSPCDEREIQWIYQTVTTLPPDFCLCIPKFEPNDLIFMIVNKKAHSDYRNGPLFKGIQNVVFLKDLKSLMYNTYNSFSEAAQSIAQIAYQAIISPNETPPREFDKLKNAFDNQNRLTNNNFEIVNRIKQIFIIADALDNWTDQHLIFDDISFLTKSWLNDTELLTRFPSLVFWICRYPQVANQIESRYNNYHASSDRLPLWLFAMRMMSSQSCIEFETKWQGNLSAIINEEITNLTRKYLNNLNNQNGIISYDWINLLLSNLPPKITNPDVITIHNFFNNLSIDNQIHPSKKINELKNNFIKDAISKITKIILENNTSNLITTDFSETNSVNQFLVFPSKYTQKKIEKSIYDIGHLILSDRSTTQLKEYIPTLDNFKKLIDELEEKVKKDNAEMKKNKDEENKIDNEKLKKEKIEETSKLINEYKEIINDIKKETRHEKLNEYATKLKKKHNQLKIYTELFDNKGIVLNEIKYASEKDFELLIMKNDGKESTVILSKTIGQEIQYLFPGETVKDDPENMDPIKSIENPQFEDIKENIDLEKIISTNIQSHPPIIVFGCNHQDSTIFISSIEELYNNLNLLGSKFYEILESNLEIHIDLFEFIKDIYESLSKIINNLQVEFSDGSQSRYAGNVLQDKIKVDLDNLYPLVRDVFNLTQNQLYPIWKALNDNRQFGKLFNYQYDVQIPTIDRNFDELIPDFSIIQNINSLASPIVCISSESQIICSVSMLKCQIGPLFPSNTSTPYLINIISFIDESVSCKIEHLNDPQYDRIISTKEKFNNNEPIQLFIMPPASAENEPETIELKGNINIQAGSYNPCLLPFQITLKILPLKVRIHCKEYNLAEENQMLRLCCNKIDSEAKINFEIVNYYIHDYFVLEVKIESLDENEANQPEILISKMMKGFSIKFPNVENPTQCQFLIKIALSQTLIIVIYCDLIIMPIVYAFEMYDIISKKYQSTKCELMSIPGTQKTLHFRMMCLFPFKKMAQISYNLPHSIQLIGKDKPLNEKFEVDGDCNFELDIIINSDYIQCPNRSNFYIGLDIENIKKSIRIEFVEPSFYSLDASFPLENSDRNNLFLKTFPSFIYNYDAKKWVRIETNDELIKTKPQKLPYCIVSPYVTFQNIDQYSMINYDSENVNVSNDKNIVFLQITAINDQVNLINEREISSPFPKDIYIGVFKKTCYYYYSVIGHDKNNNEIWFPAFDKYPDVHDMQILEYSEKNENTAKKQINKILKKACSKLTNDIPNIFTSNICCIEKTNFAIMIVLLCQKETINNIEFILEQMPSGVRDQFTDILGNIKYLKSENDNKMPDNIKNVISYNLIVRFANVFSEKYEEIKSHCFCLKPPLTEDQIKYQKKVAMDEFWQYDLSQAQEKSMNATLLFSEKETALSKIVTIQLPEESQMKECYIISQNERPVPCMIRDGLETLKLTEIDNEELIFSDSIESIASLPEIELPQILSIQSLISFYSKCSLGSRVLPAYIRSKQIKKLDQNDSEIYFAKLLTIYKDITKATTLDRSILATHVNSFIESFKNCVNRLKRAGVDFSAINLPQSCNDCRCDYNQDFIRSPEIDHPTLSHVPWKIKNQISENYIKFSDPSFNKKYALLDTTVTRSVESILNLISGEENYDKDDSTFEVEGEHVITEDDKEFILAQVATVHNKDENEDLESIDDQDNKTSQENKPLLTVNSNSLQSKITDSETFDGQYEFTELDGIERVLRRINEMKKDDKIKFLNSTECTIDHQNEKFSTDQTEFPVQSLIYNSQHLIADLICKASDSNCPFLNISCNLLFDCSSYITLENKLYSFMLLASFSYALAALEIPFSIAIVADQKFRFVLKPFEEDISVLVLQRVLDCIFIKRYRTNIADTFRHAIEYMYYPYQERTQRALFLFSNGLDENLILAQSWKETLLNNSNNSFGMIFVKSKLLDNQKYASIEKMWDDFNETVKTSKSITKIIAINNDINSATFESIGTLFSDILSRAYDKEFSFDMNKSDEKPDFKQKYYDLSEKVFVKIKEDIDYDFSELSSKIFRKVNQRYNVIGTRFPKLDVSHYRNKTEKIANSSINNQIKEAFDQFIHRIVYSKRNSYRPLLETIFKPNKASQTVLSSTGTDFDITALILNLINPVPDPLIYLEEKGGLIRNYGISIIIDSSRSCFNPLSSSHSIQSIKTLFAALSSISIPCIDVIVATKSTPVVLCSEIPSMRLFSSKSTFWPSLFNCLSENCDDYCDLESAIHAAYDIRRMRTVDSTSYMFIFSDGLFQKEQKEHIKGHVMTCIQSGISVFGIGIGIYPSGIIELFPQAIYATNPNYLIHGIASCFGDDSIDSYNDSIQHLAPEQSPFSVIKNAFDEIINNKDKPIFKDLQKYLHDVQHGMDAFSDFYNEEQESRDASGELINPEGLNTEMYTKNILKGQKILIVMPYDCRANLQENPKVSSRFLLEPGNAGEKTCVKKAVEFYGIDIVIVQNYKDAVKKLTKQTKLGFCDYYATWVISGLPYDIPLPDGGNQYLVMQFIDCLIQFWQNGGSVVMFAEGEPLTFQANLFLEKIVFPDNSKTNLRVGGNHVGKKYLKGDRSGKLNKPGLFNKSDLAFTSFQRASLSHNLVEIYEGETISYAPNEKSAYHPFIPFMKDSEEGISALFYPGGTDKQNETGDIIIDCGYTKLFDKMTEKGTFRYIQNIAGWTAQIESRRIRGIKPNEFRPKAVNFMLDESQKCTLQEPPVPPELDVSKLRNLFAIDYSGSVKNVKLYHDEVKSIFEQHYKENDAIIIWDSSAEIISLQRMQQIYENKEGKGSTNPSKIAEKLAEDPSLPHEHLILVTDGRVDSGSIEETDSILTRNNIYFRYVTTYVIGEGGDLSVGAPFTRGCGSITIEVKSNLRQVHQGANTADFRILESIDDIQTLEQFKNNSSAIFNATKQKMIGTAGNRDLKIKFQNLQRRLENSENDNKAWFDKAIQIISILIGMASGKLHNVFNMKTISAMEDKVNFWD